LSTRPRAIAHIVGERPGTEHNNFSVYISIASENDWSVDKRIDYIITKVVSGISNTALIPEIAVK
jgi:ethanolamine ammonia-lyase large subunit